MGIAKSENRIKDKAQQSQADTKSFALAEILGHGQSDQDGNKKVHARNQKQHQPSERLASHFQQDDKVVKRHNGRPARFTGFGEHFPKANDNADNDGEINDKEKKA